MTGAADPAAARERGIGLVAQTIRAPFLSITLLALSIGLGLATGSGSPANVLDLSLTLVGALCAHAGANVINDWADERNGSDRCNRDRIGPFTGGSRLIQEHRLSAANALRIGLALLAAAMLCGAGLLLRVGPALLPMGVAGLALAWAYSAPPLRLMSRGLGEAAVVAAWLLVIVGTDLVGRGELSSDPWLAGFGYALMIGALLWVNEIPDVAADALAGKRNLVVRLGTRRAGLCYPLWLVAAGGATIAAVACATLPAVSLIATLGLLPGSIASRELLRADAADGPPRQEHLRKAILSNLAAVHAYGILLAVSLFLRQINP